MPNKPFKKLEREGAKLIEGWRYPANTGGAVDFESEHLCGQAKLVKEMSLSVLTSHVLAIEGAAQRRGKKALLMVKLRAGKGVQTPALICMTDQTFREMFPSFRDAMKEVALCPSDDHPERSPTSVTNVEGG